MKKKKKKKKTKKKSSRKPSKRRLRKARPLHISPSKRFDVTRAEYNRIIRLWRAGRIDLESMITHRVGIADINQAFDLMHAGKSIRSVVTY